jgi:hypothetical protein
MAPPMEAIPPIKLYDVKIKRCIKSGAPKIRAVPQEDFLIDPDARVLDESEVRFCGDSGRQTRSDLWVKYPKKRKLIEDAPAYGQPRTEAESARQRNQSPGEPSHDPSQDKVEVFELYVKVAYDSDIAEWRQVCMIGEHGSREMLSNEPWGGMLPYTDLVPNPHPHRRRGRGLFEDMYDIQRVKTVILRQMLTNLYQVNNPRQVAKQSDIINPDVLISFGIGDTVFSKGDASAAVVPLTVPPVFKESFPMLEYLDMSAEKRTGVGRQTMALDPQVLQNQTATSANIAQDIKGGKVETFARNLSEFGGMKRLFRCLLRLFVDNQRAPKMIKLRGKWVEMDPRGWNADMNCTINTGLGTGSRDRDISVLNAVAQKQELVIQHMEDPFNPILNIGHLFETYRKMAEGASLKNPELFFPEFDEQQLQQIAQQVQAGKKSPEQAKIEGQMQIEQMKIQSEQQLGQMKMQGEQQKTMVESQADQQRDAQKAQIDQMQMQMKAEIERLQAQADIETNNRKVEADMALAQQKFEFDKQIKLLEFQLQERNAEREAQQSQREHGVKLTTMKMGAINDRAKHEMDMELASEADDGDPRVEEKRKSDESNQRTERLFGGITEALNNLAKSQSADTEIVRDPKTGRAMGARKRLN